jgi:peptidoglycan lytic transglycosylase
MTGTHRTHVMLVVLACLAPAAMTAPAAAQSAGGVAFPTGPSLQVATPNDALLGDTVTFSGTLPAAANTAVVIQRQDRTGLWIQTATTMGDASGTFTAQWRADHVGLFPVRALPASQVTTAALATVSSTSPVATLSAPMLTIYNPAIATWYGPGFFGQKMACGHRLTKHTLGVANKTLPCGTEVALDFQGRTVTVPVVDRGPFANHAHWDLTEATAHALAMTDTETIGAVSIPGSAPASASKPGASSKTPAPAPAAIAR